MASATRHSLTTPLEWLWTHPAMSMWQIVSITSSGKSRRGGVVSTFAGTGTRGHADGTGSTAQFSFPFGVAVDSSGSIYVADFSNHHIREITPEGVVSTFAGSTAGSGNGIGNTAQFNHPFGVAVDSSGNVYVVDSVNNHLIRKITPADK